MAGITIHPSMTNINLDEVLAASLRANRLDPKLLYVTPRQAELWREVSLKHSPIHTNPEFTRIYREAYARVVEEMKPGKVRLVGLGPGTGLKEAELAEQLQSKGYEVSFSAIDVSPDLVEEAAKRVGSETERHLVCDLTELDYIKGWLDADDRGTPRLFTFFGVVPNLKPAFVAQLLREFLRPSDLLLASVHLAPVENGINLESAMERILPQYNNPETLAWLWAAMEQWKLTELMLEPRIVIEWQTDIPCVRGIARRKSTHIDFNLFHSLRYTPGLFEELLYCAGVQGEMLAITACREEAIWAVWSS